MALTNGIGGLTGIAVPPFVGLMAPQVSYARILKMLSLKLKFTYMFVYRQSTLEQWRFVFWITFVISMVRITIFVLFGSAEVQPWNNPRGLVSPENGFQIQRVDSEEPTFVKRYDSEHLHDQKVNNGPPVFTVEKVK